MRQAEQDGEHIWLRQSVTFTTNGQTRTVEVSIPLRPGAPAEEIERLLNEAEAGMRRISQRLDSHVAALLIGTDSTVPAPHAAPASSAPATPAPTPAASHPAAHPERPAPAVPPAHTVAPTPVAANPSPHPTLAPAASAGPAARGRPSGPLTTPAPSPTASQTGGELSRKDFLAAANDMGLNARQVMERLGVRTLEGLNLREALEALRRQVLRGGEAAPTAPATPAPAAPATSAPPSSKSAAPAATPRYFEEEDDVVFTVDGDDTLSEELGDYEAAGIPNGASSEAADDLEDLDELSDLDLDDVPDFGPPPSAVHASHTTHTAHPAPSPARRSAPAKAVAPTSPSAPAQTAEEQESAPLASPAARRIAELRAVRGGGAPGTYQRTAYRNVVVNELGEEAANLVRGIWRVNPERLGPDQLDALISWGKQDTFAEEAADVLAALRAERQQAQTAASDGAPASTSPAAAPSRPAPRGRAPQPPRASAGGH